MTPPCLKVCAEQLAAFKNKLLETSYVPSFFKHSTNHPSSLTILPGELNDYRPIALTSVLMKTFERLGLAHLEVIKDLLFRPLAGCLPSQQFSKCGYQYIYIFTVYIYSSSLAVVLFFILIIFFRL